MKLCLGWFSNLRLSCSDAILKCKYDSSKYFYTLPALLDVVLKEHKIRSPPFDASLK